MKNVLYGFLFFMFLASVTLPQTSDPTKGNGNSNPQIRETLPRIEITNQTVPEGFYTQSAQQMKPNAVVDNKGTEFWLCMERNIDSGIRELYFDIGSDAPATGTMSIPGINYSISFTVSPDSITRVNIPFEAIIYSSEVVENKGIHIVTSSEVAIYGNNLRSYSSDSFLALPLDILSTRYLTVSYSNPQGISSEGNLSQFAIVSPYDNNTITITPSRTTLNNKPANTSFTITLMKGEVYQVRGQAVDGLNGDLTGSVIQSALPVAVFSGHSCAFVPFNVYACDILLEQLPPIDTWGKNFVASPLKGRLGGDTWRFIASRDSTELFLNDTLAAVLNFGSFYEIILTKETKINATKPILVMQYSNGDDFDGGISQNGDPFMMMIPPVEQFMNKYTFATPSTGFLYNYVTVSILYNQRGSVVLNDVALPESLFVRIGDSEYASAGVEVDPGIHRIYSSNGTPFGIYTYGFSSYDSYGYTGGMSLNFINQGTAPIITRTTETVNLSNVSQLDNQPITIAATIVKSENPPVQSGMLYYKSGNDTLFSSMQMTSNGSTYSATIPANKVKTPGVNYYIYATDGQLVATDPKVNPVGNPYTIAVLPNKLPVIIHTPITRGTPNVNIPIEAQVYDSTLSIASVDLLYRIPGGNPVFNLIPMKNDTLSNNYKGVISGNVVTEQGIEYYIKATDNYKTVSTHGSPDNPHQISTKAPVNPGQTIFSGIVLVNGFVAPVGTVVDVFGRVSNNKIGSTLVVPEQEGKNYSLSVNRGDGGVADNDSLYFVVTPPQAQPMPEMFRGPLAPAIFIDAFPAALVDYNIKVAHSPALVAIPLVQGYNAVSWNVKPNNDSTHAIFGQLMKSKKVQGILGFIEDQGKQFFTYYIPELGQYNPMLTTDFIKGYFVKLKAGVTPDTLFVSGMPVNNSIPIPLNAGYNLVSNLLQRNDITTPGEAFQSIAGYGLQSVFDYVNKGTGVPGSEMFEVFPQGDMKAMKPGKGYFVKMGVAGTLHYPDMWIGTPPNTQIVTPVMAGKEFGFPAAIIVYTTSCKDEAGNLIVSGADVVAYDSHNNIISAGVSQADGVFSLAIPGDDPQTVADEGAAIGEVIRLSVNGRLLSSIIVYSHFGDIVEVGSGVVTNETVSTVPTQFALHQNYPNPFNPETKISVDVPESSKLTISIFNALGEKVGEVFDGELQAGKHSFIWRAAPSLANGIYFCRLESNQFNATIKMILLK